MKKHLFLLLMAGLLFTSCGKDNDNEPDCDEGFTGSNCEEQITPDAIKISGVDLASMPATNNGSEWDVWSTGPDIYIQVLIDDEVAFTSNYYEDVNVYDSFYFEVKPTLTVSPESTVTIRLFDFDSANSDDFMGAIYSDIYHNKNNFPGSITFNAGGALKFNLLVYYIWN